MNFHRIMGESNNSGSDHSDDAGGGIAAADLLTNEWETHKFKAEILNHPLYDQLLAAHVSCLRIATPVDQLPRIDAQLGQSQHVVAKYSAVLRAHGNDDSRRQTLDDKDLDQFMVARRIAGKYGVKLFHGIDSDHHTISSFYAGPQRSIVSTFSGRFCSWNSMKEQSGTFFCRTVRVFIS